MFHPDDSCIIMTQPSEDGYMAHLMLCANGTLGIVKADGKILCTFEPSDVAEAVAAFRSLARQGAGPVDPPKMN